MSGWSHAEARTATWMSPERPEEAGYGKKQEILAEQPTIHSRHQCSSSDDHIPVSERKCEDITANEYSHKYFWRISDFKMCWKIGAS